MLKILIFQKNVLSLQMGKYVLATLVSVVLCLTEGYAQVKLSSPFNTIGEYHCKTVVTQKTQKVLLEVDDETEEDSIVDPPKDSLMAHLPLVALPLKRIRISSPFGNRKDPMNRKSRRMHNGLDLKARFEEVYSMLPGIVTRTSYSVNGGYYVTVNHGICVCSYLHLSKIKAKQGQHVGAGEIIAISGNSGKRTTGPHLHIACRLGDERGKFFNPMLILGFVSEQLLNNK